MLRSILVLCLSALLGLAIFTATGCQKPEQGASDENGAAMTEEQETTPTEPAAPGTPAVPDEEKPAVPDQEESAVPAVPEAGETQEAAAPEEEGPALVLHLTMDDNTSTNVVTDATGNYTVRLNKYAPEPTSSYATPGVIDGAFSFMGKEYGIKTRKTLLDDVMGANHDFTIAFWWKAAPQPIDDTQYIVRRWSGDYAQPGVAAFLYPDTNRLVMRFVLSEDLNVSANFENVNDGKWHHYVFMRNGDSLRLIRDAEVATGYTDAKATVALGDKNSLVVGPANGAIDDLRIYDGALGNGKIKALYDMRSDQ